MTKPSEIRVSRTTKSQASITIKYDYLESNECKVSIEHTLSLHANVPWIEGTAGIEWNCKHKLLKLAFDLNFWAEHLAVGQPYGHVLRRNPGSPYSTLHDRAKWEANYQGWIDYSDGKKGLAFICGTRFGYDHISRTLRITILRSPRFPPEVFDRPWTRELIESQEYFESGSYNLRYFILPHRGDFKQAEVPTIAEELLTRPYIVKVKLRKPFTLSMMEANPKRLSIPAIKLHEDKDSLIIRVVNYYDYEGECSIKFKHRNIEVKLAREVSLLEEPISNKVEYGKNVVRFNIGKYEIKTLEVKIKESSIS